MLIYSPNKLAFLLRTTREDLERIAAGAETFYSPFEIPRPGKAPRLIENPVEPLATIQKAIYKRLLRTEPLPGIFHGGVAGRSSATNAAVHVGQRVVATLDVKSCYPSITNRMVFRVWRCKFGHSPTVARLLTQLTTRKGHLPQGAATSLALANWVLVPILSELDDGISKAGLSVGQYVDDTALSGNLLPDDIITCVCRAFSRHGLKISRAKVSVMRAGAQQIVTGHTCNRKVGIPAEERSKIRAAVFQLECNAKKSRIPRKEFQRVLGRVNWMVRFYPREGAALKDRVMKVSRLTPSKAVSAAILRPPVLGFIACPPK